MLRNIAVTLGVLSGVAVVLSALALQDIYHNEPDLRLEWLVLQISFLIILAFLVTALSALLLRPPEHK